MATYSVLPDALDLQMVRGDEFGLLLDFDSNLTNYQFEATVYLPGVPPSGGGVSPPSVPTATKVTEFTVTNVDLSLGKINLSLTEIQTNMLTAGAVYRWYLRWTAPGVITRTVISGLIVGIDP